MGCNTSSEKSDNRTEADEFSDNSSNFFDFSQFQGEPPFKKYNPNSQGYKIKEAFPGKD